MKQHVLVLVLVSSSSLASAASAAEPSTFGAAGTVAIGGQLGVSHHDVPTAGGGPLKATQVAVSPTVDLFVAKNVSVGLLATGAWSSVRTDQAGAPRTDRSRFFGSQVRLGLYVPIGERFGFWPVARAGYGRQSFSHEGGDRLLFPGDPPVHRTFVAGVDAQLVLHVSEHLFLRFVPIGASVAVTKRDGYPDQVSAGAGVNGFACLGVGGAF